MSNIKVWRYPILLLVENPEFTLTEVDLSWSVLFWVLHIFESKSFSVINSLQFDIFRYAWLLSPTQSSMSNHLKLLHFLQNVLLDILRNFPKLKTKLLKVGNTENFSKWKWNIWKSTPYLETFQCEWAFVTVLETGFPTFFHFGFCTWLYF